jgi:hypothetical protein
MIELDQSRFDLAERDAREAMRLRIRVRRGLARRYWPSYFANEAISTRWKACSSGIKKLPSRAQRC